jgi:[ribosomal protein S5]-alanine N-acetyltransferase
MTGYRPASPPELQYRQPGAGFFTRTLLALPRLLVSRLPTDPRGRAVASYRRTLLAPPQPEDYQAWADLRRASRPFLEPWEPVWPNDALSRSGYNRRITGQCDEWNADRAYHFLIWRRDDAALLGGVAISNVRRGVAQAGVLGYWIGEAHAGQGLMGEALLAALNLGFGALALNRLEAATLPENEPSRRLLLRAGFAEEGYAKEYLQIAGAWRDHVLYGLTRSQYAPEHGAAPVSDPSFI